MSGSLNKVILIGNLGKDPELKMTPNGQALARIALAVPMVGGCERAIVVIVGNNPGRRSLTGQIKFHFGNTGIVAGIGRDDGQRFPGGFFAHSELGQEQGVCRTRRTGEGVAFAAAEFRKIHSWIGF